MTADRDVEAGRRIVTVDRDDGPEVGSSFDANAFRDPPGGLE
jgi:hypothetical protein